MNRSHERRTIGKTLLAIAAILVAELPIRTTVAQTADPLADYTFYVVNTARRVPLIPVPGTFCYLASPAQVANQLAGTDLNGALPTADSYMLILEDLSPGTPYDQTVVVEPLADGWLDCRTFGPQPGNFPAFSEELLGPPNDTVIFADFKGPGHEWLVTPEPGTLSMVAAAGAIGTGAWLWRKKRRPSRGGPAAVCNAR